MAIHQTERAFQVTGMSCGHCQRSVDAAIRELKDVTDVRVDLVLGLASVTGTASDSEIAFAIESAGYQAKRVSIE
jgi:copper chaperone